MNIPPDQKFFIWDAESVGLHGQAFAVAGGTCGIDGKLDHEFAYHVRPHQAESSCKGRDREDLEWVMENVRINPESVLVSNRVELIEKLWQEWSRAKSLDVRTLMFVECGWPVEARALFEAIHLNPEARNWGGPYPMHEIATMMLAAGMDPMATYERRPEELPAHEPLADSRLSARLLATAIQKIHQVHETADCYEGLCK